jgi:hypothetical protein
VLKIWKAFWELQPDRPLIVIPMGGAFRERIPGTVKDAWFARRGYVADSEDETLIRALWTAMEQAQAEVEAKSGEDA